jgi:DNA helicase-2/ATP-dependent DNA helicase PcrA
VIESILEGTNEPQRRAITHGDGPLLVVAGAGSGKTRVLTRRVAWLVATGRCATHEILAVTFTNRAANEMRERVRALAPAEKLWVSTFHSACARLLRAEIPRLGYGRDFSIYDEADRTALVREVLRDRDVDPTAFRPAAVAGTISRWKNALVSPEEAGEGEGLERRTLAGVYGEYERRRREANALDFDDLLWRTIEVLEGFPEALEAWRRRFAHVLVDEFQDTNPPQYRIVRLLAEPGRNVTVVGDPDQSIYGFRGADLSNILDFEEDFPGTTVVRLEQNYRSTKRILEAADAVIRRNVRRHERGLWTEGPEGEPLVRLRCGSDQEEAREIALQIRGLLARGMPAGEIAVLYRTNFLQRALEAGLREATIPYRIVAGVEFFERREVRDLLAYLRLLSNPRDDLGAQRVASTPPRGIGPKTIEALRAFAAEKGIGLREAFARGEEVAGLGGRARRALGELHALLANLEPLVDGRAGVALARIVEEIDYGAFVRDLAEAGGAQGPDRAENVDELVAYAKEYDRREPEGRVRGFLSEVALVADSDDAEEEGKERVVLMTLHAAKGLEFRHVFLAGCEEGLLPHARSIAEGEIEEERRLFYVGLTRARERAVFTSARTRTHFGSEFLAVPSRFLAEIPETVFDEAGEEPEPPAREEADGGGHHLRAGEEVEHPSFGRGRIVAVSGSGANARAVVDFERFGEKVLLLSYARLERIGATR